jgi:monoterpene epsilon-lactone hydrolase
MPSSISPAAQAILAAPRTPLPDFPALEDKAAWRHYGAAGDARALELVRQSGAIFGGQVATREYARVRCYVAIPQGVSCSDNRVLVDMHGGAFISGGGEVCKAWASVLAHRVRARVCSIDYRMPPDHPYPCGLNDCVAVYGELLRERRPEEIVVSGLSAGGNLAAALILRARDEGMALPAGVVLMSPEVDLTESGDSFQTNLGIDAFGSLRAANLLYADGQDLAGPYLSPLFGDFGKGFPPALLTTGTRDLFLSNTVRMHRALRAAGVPAELHVLEAGPHRGFPGAPEQVELDREIRRFLDDVWGVASDVCRG